MEKAPCDCVKLAYRLKSLGVNSNHLRCSVCTDAITEAKNVLVRENMQLLAQLHAAHEKIKELSTIVPS